MGAIERAKEDAAKDTSSASSKTTSNAPNGTSESVSPGRNKVPAQASEVWKPRALDFGTEYEKPWRSFWPAVEHEVMHQGAQAYKAVEAMSKFREALKQTGDTSQAQSAEGSPESQNLTPGPVVAHGL